ncbi:MAG: DUF309 domain-containing protein [Deltaproteobacteria bacterium]|nr:DUF309 domain-containing protein [Deltaproteobacteria bacterium]
MSSPDDRRRAFLDALGAFRRGEHLSARERWESLWRDEEDGERRTLLQSLLMLASALHRTRDALAPGAAARLLADARVRLEELPDVCMAVDVAALRRETAALAERLASRLEAGEPLVEERCELAVVGEVGPWGAAEPGATVPLVARSTWFAQGIEAYARGDFFEAHELWEQLWRDERDEGHRQLLQGLIQVAAAMHKATVEGKPGPAASLLGRALLRLATGPEDGLGLQLARLLREAREAKAALEARVQGGATTGLPLEPALIPTVARVLA